MITCKTCEYELPKDRFYFRNDTKRYHTDCKKCLASKQYYKKKNGLTKKRTVFDFICLECKTQKTNKNFYLKNKKTNRYDTTCKACRKIGAKKWHQENKETSLKNKKGWHNKNKEEHKKKCKKNYKKNGRKSRKGIRR